jgi:hypothetical protein
VSEVEQAFGVPAEHSLRLVRALRRSGPREVWEREHEEYDAAGRLVAVYESWSEGAASPAGREGGADGYGGYVKYSPDGRLMHRFTYAPTRTKPSFQRQKPGAAQAALITPRTSVAPAAPTGSGLSLRFVKHHPQDHNEADTKGAELAA